MTVFSVKNPEESKPKPDFNGKGISSKELFIKQTFFGSKKEKNFCKKYRLEDPIQEIIFNKRFNQLENIYVFSKKNDLTNLFFESIDTRLIGRSHIILYVFGKTNSGKSEVAQAISIYIKNKFKEKLNLQVKIELVFSDAESNLVLPKMNSGDIYLSDEKPKITGVGSNKVKWNLDNITEIVRKNQNSFIFVKPKKKDIDYVDYYLETAGKNIDERTTRCLLYDENFDLIGRIFVKLHEDEAFRKEYERKKDENIRKTLKKAGEVNPVMDQDRFNRDVENLLSECEKQGIIKKNKIKSKITVFNNNLDPYKDTDKMISGSSSYIEDIVNAVESIITGKADKKDVIKGLEKEVQVNVQDPLEVYKNFIFPFSMDKIINIAKKESNLRKVDRDFDIWKSREEGVYIRDILPTHPDLTNPGAITSIYNKVNGHVSKLKGHLFEKEYEKHLVRINVYDKVIRDGSQGKPDIYAIIDATDELHVFSCKCFDFKKCNPVFLMKELKPEFQYANENVVNYSVVKMFIVAYDTSEQRCYVKIVDHSKPRRVKIL